MFSLRQILLESNYQSVIEDAIKNGWLLRMSYKGEGGNRFRQRVVEPYTAGMYNGRYVMIGWHNRGFSLKQDKPEWRIFRLDRIQSCQLLKHNKIPGSNPAKGSRKIRPGYNPPDKRLQTITADIINNFKPVLNGQAEMDKQKEKDKEKQQKPVQPTPEREKPAISNIKIDKDDKDGDKEISL